MTDRIAALLDAFARRRDGGAFRALYDAATPAMLGLALRLAAGDGHAAEDLVQESWFRAAGRVNRFDSSRPGAPWLNGFILNCWRERLREQLRDAAPASASSEELVDESAELWSERPLLERAVRALPDGFRTVLVLHDIEGYTHGEIAERLHIDEGTSKSQLSRARARLRRLLTANRSDHDG